MRRPAAKRAVAKEDHAGWKVPRGLRRHSHDFGRTRRWPLCRGHDASVAGSSHSHGRPVARAVRRRLKEVPPHFAMWTKTRVSWSRSQMIGGGTTSGARPRPRAVSKTRACASCTASAAHPDTIVSREVARASVGGST